MKSMFISVETKRAEIETYSFKKHRQRPKWGEQWNEDAMAFLFKIGDAGTVDTLFNRLLKDSQCLIIGVSSGEDAVKLKNIVSYAVGVDIAKTQLVIAKSHHVTNCEYVACDAELLPFKKEVFSSIVCRATLHHLPNINTAFTQMQRVLKIHGLLILHEPGLLNPIALIGRKLFPTSIHTLGEKPFMLSYLKICLETNRFSVRETFHFYLFSPLIPIILRFFGRTPYKIKEKATLAIYEIDRILLESSSLKMLAMSFVMVCDK